MFDNSKYIKRGCYTLSILNGNWSEVPKLIVFGSVGYCDKPEFVIWVHDTIQMVRDGIWALVLV